ncbi:MAG TPA: hypothetical protein VJ992_01950 [Gemmatimonadales bacterium]|jgi:hypothetical protein|nr:hypothetical protein [Gemmatimonadales bacterium]
MLRKILGYAVLAVIGFFALKLILGLLGFALSLAFTALWLAAIGFGIYLIIKLVSPGTARRIHEAIGGKRAA